ncbi:MAG: TetR/AcrR family transcriptional regulator [Bacteroidota bacterium]
MLLKEIIKKSEDLFMRYGIRSVSMDDISRELGVSKKTIYQQIENKSDLIRRIFVNRCEEEMEEISKMRETATNAIEEQVQVVRFMINRLRTVSPTSRYDLEKYYKDIHREMDEFHQAFFQQFIQDNLKRGIAEGLYRANIDAVIVAKLFVSMAVNLGHNEYFSVHEFSLEELVRQLFHYHINGVASDEGLAVMQTYLPTQKEADKPLDTHNFNI